MLNHLHDVDLFLNYVHKHIYIEIINIENITKFGESQKKVLLLCTGTVTHRLKH